MTFIRRLVLATMFFMAFPAGIAFAHGSDCWTAGPGYTVSCGFISPIWHQDNDGFTGTLIDQFQMAATFSQTVFGSFDWQSVTIKNGWQCADCYPEYGPTYFYANGPYSPVTQASWWSCAARLDYWQYDTRAFSPNHNPTISGTWEQKVQYNGCIDPANSPHTLNVHAYAN